MRSAPHTALPRVKGMHQPRDSAVFFSKQTATATAGGRRASVEQVGTGGEGRRSRGQQSIELCVHNLPPSARLCTAAVRRSRNRDAQRHQYVGAWEGVAPVCRCVRQNSSEEGEGGGSARRRTCCRPAEGQHVDTFPPFPRGVVYGAYP